MLFAQYLEIFISIFGTIIILSNQMEKLNPK